ncbi:MAG TPA: Stp1/IreP family PP2C-type Ser/Thr phosphatase [Pyrinomonadaceae bacterium]|nr:Stp1/IreP family PP2C-type Ser/Thr phosphatase [Pyrinomonadaceae bacterium]
MQPTREFRSPELTVTAAVMTDPGCVRTNNEDNGLHVHPFVAEDRPERGSLTIVADGMGGHSSGEIASSMAVELISRYFYDDTASQPDVALTSAIERASGEIFDSSVADTRYLGMGTTVVALAIQQNFGYVAHVGDSRMYRLRGELMVRMTTDHSQVMEMVKLGIITPEEAQSHEDKNVILRAVGTQASVEVETFGPFQVEPADEFLLCSDGLSDMATDDEIRAIWLGGRDIHDSCERLVEFAKARGGNDNITVGIVRAADAGDAGRMVRRIPITRQVEV